MRQILGGVQYLHSRNIVHRDIKPENVLCVDKTWPLRVKLTDFGLSNFLGDDQNGHDPNMLLSHVGTSYYIAPEIIGKVGYGPAVDIWACGVTCYVSCLPLMYKIEGLHFFSHCFAGLLASLSFSLTKRVFVDYVRVCACRL